MALRAALHRRGLRYRVNRRVTKSVRGTVDIVFGPRRVAVFVDGCFWHQCPMHGTMPKANGDWWKRKLDANVARDARVTCVLENEGWTVIRIWEHEDPEAAAERVASVLDGRRGRGRA